MTQITKLSILTERRINNEIKELYKKKIENIQVLPDENDKLIFYFLFKGKDKTDYEGGYYIGKIILPSDYPMNPGDFMILTPNGRFNINNKICLSNTGYHKETWTPMWTIEAVVIGIYSIWLDDKESGANHIKDSPEIRRKFTKDSISYNMKKYKDIFIRFNQFINEDGTINEDGNIEKKLK
jgi:ubiquitin-conjugating enzyme E2 J2